MNKILTQAFQALKWPLFFVEMLWLVFIVESYFRLDLGFLGVYPRKTFGLLGIITSPFIHGDILHLFYNSVPFLVLGALLYSFYGKVSFKVFFWIWLLDGFGVWLFARNAYHIGASGLLYGMMSFLLISGMIRKNKQLLTVSLIVTFLYGSMVWGVLPLQPNVSWESHLTGMLAGIALAIIFRHRGPKPDPEVFPEEDDLEELDDEDAYWKIKDESDLKITYHYKPDEPEDNSK